MAAADEKVRLTAQHIVRTLATSKNAADDMIRILSGFDDRFNDLFPSVSAAAAAAAARATGDDHPGTSEEGTPAIRGDPTQERVGSPLKGYRQSPLTNVQEVNDQPEASKGISAKERDGISEDDSVKLQMAEKLVILPSTPVGIVPIFEWWVHLKRVLIDPF